MFEQQRVWNCECRGDQSRPYCIRLIWLISALLLYSLVLPFPRQVARLLEPSLDELESVLVTVISISSQLMGRGLTNPPWSFSLKRPYRHP